MIEQQKDESVGIIPRDPLTKFLFLGYRGPDQRTAVFAVHCVSYAFYSSFLLSNILFVFFYENFFNLNLKSGILVFAASMLLSLIKYGLDKFYTLSAFNISKFCIEMVIFPVFIFLMYVSLYIAAFKEMPHTALNIYLIYVVLQSIVFGIIALMLSHLISHFLRISERLKL